MTSLVNRDKKRSHSKNNKKKNSNQEKTLVLSVIDQVYGKNADIYYDVLGVPPNASIKTIAKSFLRRRRELTYNLDALQVEEEQDEITASHLKKAERKLDALLMAANILSDSKLRDLYDRRELPSRGKQAHKASPATAPKVSPAFKVKEEVVASPPGRMSKFMYDPKDPKHLAPQQHAAGNKTRRNRKHVLSFPASSERLTEEISSSSSSEGSLLSSSGNNNKRRQHQAKKTWRARAFRRNNYNAFEYEFDDDFEDQDDYPTSCVSKRGIREIRDEVVGALEDTRVSFSQVIHAFTLTEKDVEAVTGRITKANRQFRNDVQPNIQQILPICV